MYSQNDYRDYLEHHGILGQKWGKQNGPPYPLDASDHSATEKKAGWKKSLGGGRNEADWRQNITRKERKNIVKTIKKDDVRSNTVIKNAKTSVSKLKGDSTIRSAAKELVADKDLYSHTANKFYKMADKFANDFAIRHDIPYNELNDVDFHPDYWKEYDAWLKTDTKAAAANKAMTDAYDNYKYKRTALAADILGKYADKTYRSPGGISYNRTVEWAIEAAISDLDEEAKRNRRYDIED